MTQKMVIQQRIWPVFGPDFRQRSIVAALRGLNLNGIRGTPTGVIDRMMELVAGAGFEPATSGL